MKNVISLIFAYCMGQAALLAQLPKPYLLKDINQVFNWQSCDARNFTLFDNHIYFAAYDGQKTDLWKTNGTTAGTVRVRDIVPGLNQNYVPFPVIGNKMFFAGYSQTNGEAGIWVSDGTNLGTNMLKSFGTSIPPNFDNFTVFNDKLLFTATDQTGVALWTSDGTTSGTIPLAYFPQNGTNDIYPRQLTVVGDKVYFIGLQDDNFTDFWVSDGTSNGTQLLKKYTGQFSPSLSNLSAFNGKTLFCVIYPNEGAELLITDGTPNGTVKLANIGIPQSYILKLYTLFNGTIYFSGMNQTGGEEELWKSDGTVAGTQQITQTNGFKPFNFTPMGNWLYFTAGFGNSNYRLWRTDGTAQHTILLDDFDYFISDDGRPMTVFQDHIYLSVYVNDAAEDGDRQLWSTNGEPNGLQLLKELTQNGFGDPYNFYVHQDKLYFWAFKDYEFGSVVGPILWSTDGTPDNTNFIEPIYKGNLSSFIPVDDLLYVIAENESFNGISLLFLTDGTTAGTHSMVPDNADIQACNPSSSTGVGRLNGSLIFKNKYDDDFGDEVYIINPDGSSGAFAQHPATPGIKAFPNPSAGQVMLDLGDVGPAELVRVYGLDGKLIFTHPLDGHTDIVHLELPNKGIYIASVVFRDGTTSSKRILVL